MKNSNVYKIRRKFGRFYIRISEIIGFPITFIGAGGDQGEKLNPVLLIPGFILIITGLILMLIFRDAENEIIIREESENYGSKNVQKHN